MYASTINDTYFNPHFDCLFLFVLQNARVCGGEREKRSTHPCARQKEQSMGGEGEMHHHVEVHSAPTRRDPPKKRARPPISIRRPDHIHQQHHCRRRGRRLTETPAAEKMARDNGE